MDYVPEEMSSSLATSKKTLSPQSLSTLRVMAFLDPKRVHNSLFEPLRRFFAVKNEALNFDYPTTAETHKEACVKLVEASLIYFSKKDKAYSMRSKTQTSVLADTQTAGLISPLFNGIVKVLSGLWKQMVCVPDRTVDQDEYNAATAPGTNYEAYLKKRYIESRLPPFQEYVQYANLNVWGRRNELVHHIARLEQIFYHMDDDMVDVCATVTFAMLLAEAAWYYFERSRYHEAKVKIDSALGVYELGGAKSSLHHASIYRIHAALALESGRLDEAARYVDMQVKQLALHNTAQGNALKRSGLLDQAPDAISLSLCGTDVPPGNFVVLPFRSICNFGFKLYLSAQDETDQTYPQCLHFAETCFLTALNDCKKVHDMTTRMKSRIGELHYALGNVATKQTSFLGKAHTYTSLDHYEHALQYFQSAITDSDNSGPAATGIAKTHYKLATAFIRIQDYNSATHHLNEASHFYATNPLYEPHLARLLFQRSRVETLLGDPNAQSSLHSAFALRVAIRGGIAGRNEIRDAEELTEADFDGMVGV